MRQEVTYAARTAQSPPPVQLPGKRVFAFDLDGTITTVEMLPRIARLAKLEKELTELTARTLRGEIGFEQSFRARFAMLRHIPLALVHEVVADVPLDPHIRAFIRSRPDDCAIVTGNLDLWVMPILNRLGCRYFASRGAFTGNGLSLLSVLDKGDAARRLQSERYDIVAIGESMNDLPLFRAAGVGIAYAGVHAPVPAILGLAKFCVCDGASLCRLLESIFKD